MGRDVSMTCTLSLKTNTIPVQPVDGRSLDSNAAVRLFQDTVEVCGSPLRGTSVLDCWQGSLTPLRRRACLLARGHQCTLGTRFNLYGANVRLFKHKAVSSQVLDQDHE